MSTAFPVKALTAGIVVIVAIKNTKIKLAFALMGCGRNGIETIPAMGNSKNRKNNKESVIDS